MAERLASSLLLGSAGGGEVLTEILPLFASALGAGAGFGCRRRGLGELLLGPSGMGLDRGFRCRRCAGIVTCCKASVALCEAFASITGGVIRLHRRIQGKGISMDAIRVRGGSRLEGSVWTGGSKNASLPILAATLLCDGPVVLDNVPQVRDIGTMLGLLERLGMTWSWQDDGSLRLELCHEDETEAPYHLVRQMRASFCLLGPLWAKRGQATVSMPGGCAIGERPVDLHLKGMRALGARIDLDGGNIRCSGRVSGGSVYLGGSFGSTVLGTANVLMAAVLADGETRIDYAAQEPEIEDLCGFLTSCGAQIEGVGSHCLKVRGVKSLSGCRYRVIEDRIEAGTMVIAGLMTRGEVEVLGARPDHLSALVDCLRFAQLPIELGVRALPLEEIGSAGLRQLAEHPHVERRSESLGPRQSAARLQRKPNAPLVSYRTVFHETASGESQQMAEVPFIRSLPWDGCEAVDMSTLPYPGFPTDLQAQFMALMCLADGISVITEKIYPDRFIHIAELARLGAKIRRSGPVAIVEGGRPLSGASVMASDLRASAALVLAGLVAEGETTVRRVYHLDRGYDRLEEKMRRLGGQVERVREG